ncbi:hypothetical protein [Actinomadura sp. 9N407]|uniref:hypothetical protein n=1 Tax=Actinomadura sp. 9N407 TaxID=3375154 RepID=UPI0037932545
MRPAGSVGADQDLLPGPAVRPVAGAVLAEGRPRVLARCRQNPTTTGTEVDTVLELSACI